MMRKYNITKIYCVTLPGWEPVCYLNAVEAYLICFIFAYIDNHGLSKSFKEVRRDLDSEKISLIFPTYHGVKVGSLLTIQQLTLVEVIR